MENQLAAGGFEARLYNLKTHIGLVIKEARVRGANLIARISPPGAEMLEPADFEAHIDAQGLAVFLDERSPGGLKDFEVEIGPGKIDVRATASMIVPIRVRASCSLRIDNERRLYVDLLSAEVMGVGAAGLVEGQIEKINPVLDVKDLLPVETRLKTVEIGEGLIVLKGSVRLRSG